MISELMSLIRLLMSRLMEVGEVDGDAQETFDLNNELVKSWTQVFILIIVEAKSSISLLLADRFLQTSSKIDDKKSVAEEISSCRQVADGTITYAMFLIR